VSRALSGRPAPRSIGPMTTPSPALDPVARVRAELDAGKFHPLEIFPFFRRWPCGMGRDLLYTFIWNMGFALVFLAMNIVFSGRFPGWPSVYMHFFIANVIGYTIHLAFSAGSATGLERWARNTGYGMKVLYYSVIPTLAVFFGFWVVAQFLDVGFRNWLMRPGVVMSVFFSSVVISIVLGVVMFWRERSAVAEAFLERERAKGERIEREAALANLRALQAQIEPHFLFNTLANVTGLIDPDPAKAKRMLESFIRFLRASLAAMRSESTTLGAEGDMIGAYLDVLAVRMGDRLRYTIDIDPAIAAFELPQLLLQPIVENAIKHGLEPKVDGGEIAVRARGSPGFVDVEIADTGIGFAPVTAGGVGLTNIRDRLRLLYGERASLVIRENAPAGTVVHLRLPA
jgi:sensor histidine kinase YesM